MATKSSRPAVSGTWNIGLAPGNTRISPTAIRASRSRARTAFVGVLTPAAEIAERERPAALRAIRTVCRPAPPPANRVPASCRGGSVVHQVVAEHRRTPGSNVRDRRPERRLGPPAGVLVEPVVPSGHVLAVVAVKTRHGEVHPLALRQVDRLFEPSERIGPEPVGPLHEAAELKVHPYDVCARPTHFMEVLLHRGPLVLPVVAVRRGRDRRHIPKPSTAGQKGARRTGGRRPQCAPSTLCRPAPPPTGDHRRPSDPAAHGDGASDGIPRTFIRRPRNLSREVMNSVFRSGPPNTTFEA